MKKVVIFLSIVFFITAFNFAFGKEESGESKKTSQEETTDKFFKNIVDSIEKTTEDSVNKIARDIKDIKKEKK